MTQHNHSIRLLSVSDMAEKLSVGISTVWRYSQKNPEFPKPFSTSARCTRWIESEVDQYLSVKASTRSRSKMKN